MHFQCRSGLSARCPYIEETCVGLAVGLLLVDGSAEKASYVGGSVQTTRTIDGR